MKNIADRALKYKQFKVKVLYSSYLNQHSEHGKIPTMPDIRFVIRENGTLRSLLVYLGPKSDQNTKFEAFQKYKTSNGEILVILGENGTYVP